MRYTIFFLLAFVILISCGRREPVQFAGATMGTTYLVKIIDVQRSELTAETLQTKVDSLLREVNLRMSTYIDSSEISRFNDHSNSNAFVVSPSFVEVLDTALNIYAQSDGAFDVTVAPLVDLWGFGRGEARSAPPDADTINRIKTRVGAHHIKIIDDSTIIKTEPNVRLDLSAIAKGYGVDAVAALLDRLGYEQFMVEIGGEVVVRGSKNGDPWIIAIDQPAPDARHGKDIKALLQLKDIAVASSGDYRNFFRYGDTLYSHAIDPRTGRPVQNGVTSVTVLAPNCMLADAFATAFMVMGVKQGMALAESRKNVEAYMIVRRDGAYEEFFSSGFKSYMDRDYKQSLSQERAAASRDAS